MISIERVTKRYGDLIAVDDVSFAIDRGEVVGFLGPNGAGKTTTMRMLTGTLQPDAGDIVFDGHSITERLILAKSRIGYLPESNPLYPEMIVHDYLDYVGRIRRMSIKERRRGIERVVHETGLEAVFFRPIGELSKGYRQRTGMAAAILHEPDILVLDEPTEGLDPNQRVEIRRLVNELGKRRTVLLSTHVMQEVEAVCDRLVIISRGAIVADGSVKGLTATKASDAGAFNVEVQGEGVEEALRSIPGVIRTEGARVESRANGQALDQSGDRWRIRVHANPSKELRPEIYRMAVEKGWILWELGRRKTSLEEVFRNLTTGSGREESDAS